MTTTMRLFLLPVSSRRTLLYCERLNEQLGQQQSTFIDKTTVRAAKLWSDWERKPTGTWQHRVVSYGNAGLRRITFEEWGLKSVPPLSSRLRAEAAAKQAKQDGQDIGQAEAVASETPVEVIYPSSVIPEKAVMGVLHRLSTEREELHRKRLFWCFVGMPISAPFGLVPIIPNIPFFYLAFRAWSHWRALSGGKHIQHLLQNNELVYKPSSILDAVYEKEKQDHHQLQKHSSKENEVEERLLISNPQGSKAVAEAFELPALELELERAIWQVETALVREKTEVSQPHQASSPEPQREGKEEEKEKEGIEQVQENKQK